MCLDVPGEIVSGASLARWRQVALAEARAAAVPVAEVDWLLAATTNLDRASLQLETFGDRREIALSVPLAELEQLWKRRICDRAPVQYLVGEAPWRDLVLQVSPAVLVPRPETELLVELALAAARSRPELASGPWLDLGTGSGAIAIALARLLPEAEIYAVDLSAAALAVARENAARSQVAGRIQWLCGSWFSAIPASLRLQGIVANPPYIPSAEIPKLQPEVTQHEPHLALDGGPDGLDCLRELVAAAPAFLVPGGFWAVEVGYGQAPAVVDLLRARGCYDRIAVRSDLSGVDRFVSAERC